MEQRSEISQRDDCYNTSNGQTEIVRKIYLNRGSGKLIMFLVVQLILLSNMLHKI
jgi:hypothetical protein